MGPVNKRPPGALRIALRALVVAAVFLTSALQPSHALPDQQVSCVGGSSPAFHTTSLPDPNVSVIVKKASPGVCLLQFSAETVRTSQFDTLFLQYKINGGSCHFAAEADPGGIPHLGPTILRPPGGDVTATGLTTTLINSIFLSEGSHTIQPCYIAAMGPARVDFRCLTIECQKDERGPPGEKGSDGREGLPGKDGRDGRDGKDGLPGPAVRSVAACSAAGCGCSRLQILRLPAPCAVTSDTGGCSWSVQGGACCVCAP